MRANNPSNRMIAVAASAFRRRDMAGRLFFGFAAVVLYILTEFWYEIGEPWGPGTSASLAYALFFVHLGFGGRRLAAIDPVVWIPVAMLLFYFGMPVAVEILYPEPLDYDAWRVGVSPNLYRGFCALLMGFASFLFGIHLAGLRPPAIPKIRTADHDRSLAAPGMVMTLGALAMVAFGVALVGPSVVFGYYGDWWAAKTAGADARFVDAGMTFLMSGVFSLLACDDPRQPLRRYFAYFIGTLIALMLIQKGDRGALIGFGIGLGWCYSQAIRRVRPSLALVAAVVTLMALPLLREFREDRTIAQKTETAPRALLGDAFYEMGSTANAMAYTLDLIPRTQGYAWGITYVDALLQAIPNLGLTPGKTFVLYGVGREFTYGTRISPSAWITEQLSPEWFDMGGGFGFAMAAEYYYNFGMPAVLLAMTFFGWLTARIRNASNRSALVLVASALYFGAMTGYVRNVIGYSLKVVVWPVMGLIIIRLVLRLLSRPRPRARHQPGGPALGIGDAASGLPEG